MTTNPPSEFVNLTLTRRQAEHLFQTLLTLAMRGYNINGVDARLRFALEQNAGDKVYDWASIGAGARRNLIRKARDSQYGKSVR